MSEQVKNLILQLKEQLLDAEKTVTAIKKAIEALEQIEHGGANQLTLPEKDDQNEQADLMSPLDAVTALFEHNHEKKLYPRDVRDHLKKMQDMNLLLSRSDDMLSTAHNCIKSLEKKDMVQKGGRGREKWNRLKQD
jgi:hypothetical protein